MSSYQQFFNSGTLPGSQNTEADFESQKDRHELQWRLNPIIFRHIMDHFGQYSVDLFAAIVNVQLPLYVS